MKLSRTFLSLAAVAVLLAGCGEGQSATTEGPVVRPARGMNVLLDGRAGAQTVGILMAEKLGYFYDRELYVQHINAVGPERPIQYMTEDSVEIAVSHEPQVVLSQAEAVPIVAVGSLVDEPTASMIWLPKSGIRDISDLKGKTIAIPTLPFVEALLGSVLARAGLSLDDVKVESVGFESVTPLVTGRADALFGGCWNLAGIELEARGLHPVVTKVQSLGIPDYDELVVIARRDRVAEDPQATKLFMSAVAEGTVAAIEHPESAVAVIAEENPGQSKALIRSELEATLPLLSRTGDTDPDQTSSLTEWMEEEGMLER